MAERIIDYDRGVLIRNHPGSGMDVFMYVDMPGKYYTAHGKLVPEGIAGEAGYDVEKLGKEKLRLERIAQASSVINAEFADDKDQKEDVVIERDGFKLVDLGLGRHNVVDPDGNILNANFLSIEIAEKLFNSFAPEKVEEKEGKNKK